MDRRTAHHSGDIYPPSLSRPRADYADDDSETFRPHSAPVTQQTSTLPLGIRNSRDASSDEHRPSKQELTSAETTPGTAETAAPRRMATVDSFMMIVDDEEEMFTDMKTKFYVLQSKKPVVAESIEVDELVFAEL